MATPFSHPNATNVLWLGGTPSASAGEYAALQAVGISVVVAQAEPEPRLPPYAAVVFDTRTGIELVELEAKLAATTNATEQSLCRLHIGKPLVQEPEARHRNLLLSTMEFGLLLQALIRTVVAQAAAASLRAAMTAGPPQSPAPDNSSEA